MQRATLHESLKMNLPKLTLDEFAKLFINETSAIEEFYKLCHNVKCGNTISLLFNPHRLDTTTVTSDISIYGSLQYDNLLDGLARLYLYNLEHNVNNSFYQAIQRGYNGIQYVNEFPPYVARSIILKYSNKSSNIKVLDPCCGWGGRMIGVASVPNSTYIGFEPSTQTYNGLCKLGNWLKSLQPSFNFKIYNIPYEDSFDIGLTDFDVALTSPPYYDTEHYSDEETNSLNRYNSFDNWILDFYTPLILKTVERLNDNPFILNVGSRKYPLENKLYEICKNNSLNVMRIEDYLSGHGEGKEKFYLVSKKQLVPIKKSLF